MSKLKRDDDLEVSESAIIDSNNDTSDIELDSIDVRTKINLEDSKSSESQTNVWTKFAKGPIRKISSSESVSSVAEFINPQPRLKKVMRQRDWAQRGLVKGTPDQSKLRYRILPRSIIGISLMLLCSAIGVAFSGAAFYAYYDNRLTENEEAVVKFVDGFDKQFNDAAGALDQIRSSSIEQIRDEMAPVENYVADNNAVISLPGSIGESVWLLETRNEEGSLSVGSAFAVIGHEGGTAFLTSYDLIKTSTTIPAPPIQLVKDNKRITASIWSWDEERDLALLVVDQPIEVLEIANNISQIEAIGSGLYAMSGVGGQGSTASPGLLLDNSLSGLQHSAPVGSLFNGGPLVDAEGKLLGLASNSYMPFGVDPGSVGQAPDIQGFCVKILKCSETSGIMAVELGEVEVDIPEPEQYEIREEVESSEVVEEISDN